MFKVALFGSTFCASLQTLQCILPTFSVENIVYMPSFCDVDNTNKNNMIFLVLIRPQNSGSGCQEPTLCFFTEIALIYAWDLYFLVAYFAYLLVPSLKLTIPLRKFGGVRL